MELPGTAQEDVYGLINAAANAYQDAAKNMPTSLDYQGRFLHTLVVKDKASRRRQAERERRAEGQGSQHGKHSSQQSHERQQQHEQRNAGPADHEVSSTAGHAAASTLARLTPPHSASVPYARSGLNGGNTNSPGNNMNGTSTSSLNSGNDTATSPNGATQRPVPGLITSSIYQPRTPQAPPPNAPLSIAPAPVSGSHGQTQSQSQSQASFNANVNAHSTGSYGSHGWHFPTSPHLPAHPLVSPDGEMPLELHIPYPQSAGGAGVTGGGGGGGGGMDMSGGGTVAGADPNMKMELAYWYNMHSEMGEWAWWG